MILEAARSPGTALIMLLVAAVVEVGGVAGVIPFLSGVSDLESPPHLPLVVPIIAASGVEDPGVLTLTVATTIMRFETEESRPNVWFVAPSAVAGQRTYGAPALPCGRKLRQPAYEIVRAPGLPQPRFLV